MGGHLKMEWCKLHKTEIEWIGDIDEAPFSVHGDTEWLLYLHCPGDMAEVLRLKTTGNAASSIKVLGCPVSTPAGLTWRGVPAGWVWVPPAAGASVGLDRHGWAMLSSGNWASPPFGHSFSVSHPHLQTGVYWWLFQLLCLLHATRCVN